MITNSGGNGSQGGTGVFQQEHAFVVALENDADHAFSADPLEIVEVYDSGATCHISPY